MSGENQPVAIVSFPANKDEMEEAATYLFKNEDVRNSIHRAACDMAMNENEDKNVIACVLREGGGTSAPLMMASDVYIQEIRKRIDEDGNKNELVAKLIHCGNYTRANIQTGQRQVVIAILDHREGKGNKIYYMLYHFQHTLLRVMQYPIHSITFTLNPSLPLTKETMQLLSEPRMWKTISMMAHELISTVTHHTRIILLDARDDSLTTDLATESFIRDNKKYFATNESKNRLRMLMHETYTPNQFMLIIIPKQENSPLIYQLGKLHCTSSCKYNYTPTVLDAKGVPMDTTSTAAVQQQ